MSKKTIICPKCGSHNCILQSETDVKIKRRGCLGWIWWIFLAFCTLGLILIIPLLTNSKVKTKHKTITICQNCGHKWKV
jgi:DNA-directed RNA polymerase subunit M/transcription elongation factor TFIIS